MIRRASEYKWNDAEEFFKGKGTIKILDILPPDDMKPNGRKFALFTLPPGTSLGYHVHKGDSETYYILTGRGLYSENGKMVEVSAGDMTFCPDGEGHSLENISDEPLTYIALILYTLNK